MPEPLKYITAPLFRNKLVKNTHYRQYRQLLAERESASKEAIDEYQFNELKNIVNYAYQWVPYYKKLFDQVGFRPESMKSAVEIKTIPFLTKELIRDNFEQLISTAKVPGGHYIATTGGSTGEPLKVLLDYDCVFKENAFVNHFRSRLGYQLTDRLATFRGVEFGDKLWKYNPMQNELIFSPFKLSKKTLTKYVERINSYKPNYLNGYLSSLFFLAKLLSEQSLRLKIPLKGIFLISENIDQSQREFVEKFFGVPSSTFYGHSERCIIAEEILPNEYHFDPYYGYTELIAENNGKFSIVGTGFLNKTMPLIRYKTDDKCKIGPLGHLQILGRRDANEYLIGANDEKVFHSAFNFHSEIFKNVNSYQFFQKEKGIADLILIVNDKFKPSEIELMKKEIDKKTKGVIDFNIKVVDQLILSKRGKFKMFVSEINE
jgi:phenylacetate-CoA ligase